MMKCYRCGETFKEGSRRYKILVNELGFENKKIYDLESCWFCWTVIDKFLSRGGANPEFPRYPAIIDERMQRMVELLFHELELLRAEDCRLTGEEFIPLYRKYSKNTELFERNK
jgi:hypothetical protein